MRSLRWGIIGPGAIAHNFADGLKEAPSGALLAIASRDEGRRAKFGDEYGIAAEKRYSDYAALAADADVDAVYISTPHPFHAELAIMAMRVGKPVLCEKPAGMTVGPGGGADRGRGPAGRLLHGGVHVSLPSADRPDA